MTTPISRSNTPYSDSSLSDPSYSDNESSVDIRVKSTAQSILKKCSNEKCPKDNHPERFILRTMLCWRCHQYQSRKGFLPESFTHEKQRTESAAVIIKPKRRRSAAFYSSKPQHARRQNAESSESEELPGQTVERPKRKAGEKAKEKLSEIAKHFAEASDEEENAANLILVLKEKTDQKIKKAKTVTTFPIDRALDSPETPPVSTSNIEANVFEESLLDYPS